MARAADFIELTKPRITFLVLITTAVGFYLGAPAAIDGALLIHTIIGTALVASGAGALNQYVERDFDARMARTKHRPIPDRRIGPEAALVFSAIISTAGILYLGLAVNRLPAMLAAITLLSYIFIYTPLKTRTPLSTLIGAVPGAIPPMIGWSASERDLGAGAWILFGILYLWQLPHFFAIAWMFTEDYARGGFSPLTVEAGLGESKSKQIVVSCFALIPVSLFPTMLGITGMSYFFGAVLLGLAYLAFGLAVAAFRSSSSARLLLRASVLYLPMLLILMMLDKL